MIKDIIDAVFQVSVAWDTLIAEIRKLNPTALIVAVSVMDKSQAPDFDEPLGKPILAMVNNHMKDTAKYCDNYIYVDIGLPDLTDSKDGSHLGTAGHREVADKIIAAIDSYQSGKDGHSGLFGDMLASLLGLDGISSRIVNMFLRIIERITYPMRLTILSI